MAKGKKRTLQNTTKKNVNISTKKATKPSLKKASLPAKKAAISPAVGKKVKDLEKRIAFLEEALREKEETVTIDYEVKFFGGAGQIRFKGENLDRTETGATSFQVEQTKGKQRVQVGGAAPEGDNGRIEVQVKQGSKVISPFSENTFTKGIILEMIIYSIN